MCRMTKKTPYHLLWEASRSWWVSIGHRAGDANPDVIIWAVGDPACVYLRQHLSPEGLQMLDPMEEVPEGQQFIRQLLEKQRCNEEKMLIISALDHTSEVFAHLSSCCADLSSPHQNYGQRKHSTWWWRPQFVLSSSSMSWRNSWIWWKT